MTTIQKVQREIKQEWDKFLRVPHQLFEGFPYWVPPLFTDEDAVFNSKTNTHLQMGEVSTWIAYEGTKTIGRIAAFAPNNKDEGGIGFFCAEREDVGIKLMETAISWLIEKGLKTVEAPINFGERDRFWGLMVMGFERHGYLENFNLPEYESWFAKWGFQPKFKQRTWISNKKTFRADRLQAIADRVKAKGNYRFEAFNRKQLLKFGNDFTTIYNDAWQQHAHFEKMDSARVIQLFKLMLPLIEDDFIIFGYDGNEPIGFNVSLLNADWFFKKAKGKMGLKEKALYVWFRYMKKHERIRGVVFGIRPKWHNMGIEAGLLMKMYHQLEAHPDVFESELSWIGDFNPRMEAMLSGIGAEVVKEHVTFGMHLSDFQKI